MARGRKRKSEARRKKNGKVADPTADEIKSVVRVQRYKRQVMRDMDSPKREGPLGDAYMCGEIDDADLEAARLYSDLLRRYASVLNVPMAPPKTTNYARQYGITLKPDIPPDRAEKIKQEYYAVFEALSAVGRAAVTEVNRVCVYAEPVHSVSDLKRALAALKAHFCLNESQSEARRIRAMLAPGEAQHGS